MLNYSGNKRKSDVCMRKRQGKGGEEKGGMERQNTKLSWKWKLEETLVEKEEDYKRTLFILSRTMIQNWYPYLGRDLWFGSVAHMALASTSFSSHSRHWLITDLMAEASTEGNCSDQCRNSFNLTQENGSRKVPRRDFWPCW